MDNKGNIAKRGSIIASGLADAFECNKCNNI